MKTVWMWMVLLIGAAGLVRPVAAEETSAQIEIHELTSYSEFTALEQSEDIWYIFDLDNTVLRPEDETLIGTHQWNDRLVSRFMEEKKIDKGAASGSAAVLLYLLQHYLKLQVTEDSLKPLMGLIDTARSTRFALTARWQRSRATTLGQLKKLGISFAGHGPLDKENKPLLPDGVAMADMISKGQLLTNLLENAARPPKRIVMFDDQLHNLESIRKAVEEWNRGRGGKISFTGYRYAGSDRQLAELKSPRTAMIADLQARTFLSQRTIVLASTIAKELDQNSGEMNETVRRNILKEARRLRCESLFD